MQQHWLCRYFCQLRSHKMLSTISANILLANNLLTNDVPYWTQYIGPVSFTHYAGSGLVVICAMFFVQDGAIIKPMNLGHIVAELLVVDDILCRTAFLRSFNVLNAEFLFLRLSVRVIDWYLYIVSDLFSFCDVKSSGPHKCNTTTIQLQYKNFLQLHFALHLCGPLQYNAAIQVFYNLQKTCRLLAAVVKKLVLQLYCACVDCCNTSFLQLAGYLQQL